jgi:hypothetical protein
LVPEEVKLLVMPFPKVAVIEFVPFVNERFGVFKTQVKVFVATEAVRELEATSRMVLVLGRALVAAVITPVLVAIEKPVGKVVRVKSGLAVSVVAKNRSAPLLAVIR